jgi:hypothetical protein
LGYFNYGPGKLLPQGLPLGRKLSQFFGRDKPQRGRKNFSFFRDFFLSQTASPSGYFNYDKPDFGYFNYGPGKLPQGKVFSGKVFLGKYLPVVDIHNNEVLEILIFLYNINSGSSAVAKKFSITWM